MLVHIQHEFYSKTSWIFWMAKERGKNDPLGNFNWTWLHGVCILQVWQTGGDSKYAFQMEHRNIYESGFSRSPLNANGIDSTESQVFSYIFCWLKKNGLREKLAYIIYLHSLFTFTLTIEMERVALATNALLFYTLEDISCIVHYADQTSFVWDAQNHYNMD